MHAIHRMERASSDKEHFLRMRSGQGTHADGNERIVLFLFFFSVGAQTNRLSIRQID